MEKSHAYVLACNKCSVVISTFVHFIEDDQEHDLYVLEESCADVVPKLFTSLESFDKFCCYIVLYCPKCETAVGKQYKSNTPAFPKYNNKHVFPKDKLKIAHYSVESSSKSTPTFSQIVKFKDRKTKVEYRETNRNEWNPFTDNPNPDAIQEEKEERVELPLS